MKRKASVFVFSAISASFVARVFASPITPGDLMVYRVGDGSAALTSSSTAVFLDEYSPSGTLVQSIAMPTVANGLNNPLTASGTASSEGELTLSGNGQYLLLTGYAAAPGVTKIASTATSGGSGVLRDVGEVDMNGNIDTSTTTTSFSANNPRSAASQDGTTIYVSGANSGIISLTKGGSGTGTTISTSVTNNRQLQVYNSQLYVGTGSGTAFRIATVGSGLPTTTGQTYSEIPGITATSSSAAGSYVVGPYGYVLSTLDNASTPDILYVADNSYNNSTGSTALGGIEKFTLTSTGATLDGVVPLPGVTGLTGVPTIVNGTPEEILYATTPGDIYSLTDTGGALSGSPTVVAAAGTNEAFLGIVAVPEPASFGMLICGGAGLLMRRRRSV